MEQLVSLTKNADIDKYKYYGYGIGFDIHFSHSGGGTSRNVMIFGAYMSSSTKIDNKKRYLNSWRYTRSYTRIRTYTVYRKNVFN